MRAAFACADVQPDARAGSTVAVRAKRWMMSSFHQTDGESGDFSKMRECWSPK